MLHLLDWPLLALVVNYFVLSFAMQRVINRLPLLCALFWPFIASWGICWVVIGYAVVAQYTWPDSTLWMHVIRLAIIFAAALPGQWVAYRNQIKLLIEIFSRFNINKQTTGHTIFFRELFKDEESIMDSDNYNHCLILDGKRHRYSQPAHYRVKSPRNWRDN